MPRIARELTAIEVRRLTEVGYHAVGRVAGLYLQITPSGTRSWILRISVAGKRREIGLGAYPGVTLALAHEKAQAHRDAVIAGIDPVLQRESGRAALRALHEEERRTAWTFRRCAEKFIEQKRAGWKNAKHTQQWENTLITYAYPTLGKMPVRDVKVEHVMCVIEPLWTKKNETINRVRNRIEQVLDWAAVHGYRDQSNPARWRGCIDKLLPRPSSVAPVEHHPALAAEDMYSFMCQLRQVLGNSARCLEFVVLTACRSGAARLATWSEIDLKRRVWTIPDAAGRKMGRVLRVPLSATAMKLLKAQPKGKDEDFVFPGSKGKALSDMALLEVMRGMGLAAVPHGFRSTFSSWCASMTAYPSEVREMALGHTVGSDTERAYQRDDLFQKRCQLMEDWATFIENEKPTHFS